MQVKRRQLLARFAKRAGDAAASPVVARGTRRKCTFRLEEETAVLLRVVKLATGMDMNGLCDRILHEAVTAMAADLRTKSTPEAWDVMVRCAQGRRG